MAQNAVLGQCTRCPLIDRDALRDPQVGARRIASECAVMGPLRRSARWPP